jgi:AcrR family transcriptional regulator
VVVFAAQGDPRRSMALLWRGETGGTSREASSRPGLSVDAIVDAAIVVADAEGMAALSMRAVGERLGRTAMALYAYVPGKSELIDLMYDRALSELPTDYDLSPGWRAVLTSWAEDTWSFYLRHPWILQVSQARPVLGPHEFTALETLARILCETRLSPRRLRGIVGMLLDFVRGAAQTIADARYAPTATGMSDDEWWSARSGVLEAVAPDFAQRFPTATWLESQAAVDLEDGSALDLEHEAKQNLDMGLSVLLDGIEAAVGRND